MRTASVFFLFGSLALVEACATPSASEGSPSTDDTESALIAADRDNQHTFAVGVCGAPIGPTGYCTSPGAEGRRCTGTLIAPNLVLTARHCVQDPKFVAADFCANTWQAPPSPPSGVWVTLAPSTIAGPRPTWRGVSKVILPPGTNNCDDDLALLQLAANIPAVRATPVPPAPRGTIGVAPQLIDLVGRGGIDETLDLSTFDDTVVRAGLYRRVLRGIPAVCISKQGVTCTTVDYSSDPPSFTLTRGLDLYGPATAPGDSGAGVLVHLDDPARRQVLGVMTLGTYDAHGKSNSSIAVDLGPHMTWLQSAAQDAAHEGGYAPPGWSYAL